MAWIQWNQDHRILSYSANCSYSTRIRYGGRSLVFQFFTYIIHSTKSLKKINKKQGLKLSQKAFKYSREMMGLQKNYFGCHFSLVSTPG